MRARFTRTSSGLTRTHTISAGVGTGNSNKRVATRIESAINMSNTLAGGNVNIAQHGGTPTFMGMMQGLAPETSPGQMAQLYRDCYYNDSIAGSTVDMSAMFPFSDYTLTGLSTAEIDLYEASLARLNMRSLMSEIGATYLADGAFIGSLVFDSDARTFQDVLVHDTAQAEISMQPLHTMDPVIKVNTANSLQNFFNSNSPYIEQMLSGYPRALIEGFMDGPTHLDPLSTLFIPRRGLQDRTHNSYLHRLIPIFLLEKVLYRGTLLELSRRQRSTTHVKMGDENWIPTDEELQSGLAEFQMTEYDPLGAWIATRQGIEINEIRSHSEFFKWTDIVETLVPLKLRALSISEAFLSGDACLAGDTLIATDKGLVRIDSAYKDRVRNKVMPLGWNTKSRYGNAKSKAWIYNGFREVFNVETELGNNIVGTANHPVLVLSKDGATEWKRIDKLEPGVDIMCVSTDKLTRKTKLSLNLEGYKASKRELNHNSYREVDIPKVMSPELARALAYIVAEGYTSTEQFTFANTNKDIVDTLVGTLKAAFNLDLNVYEKSVDKIISQISNENTYLPTKPLFSVKTTAKSFIHLLNELGVYLGSGRREGLTPSYFKRVPWSILEADEESQLAFLAGYIDCDGSVRDRITFISKSTQLLRDIQAMLNAMGYAAKLQASHTCLELCKEDSVEIWSKLKPYLVSKQIDVSLSSKYTKLDGVPAAHWLDVINSAKLGHTRHGATYRTSLGKTVVWSENKKPFGFRAEDIKRFNYSYYKQGRYTNFLALLKIISPQDYVNLVELLKLEYRFTVVTSITCSGKEHVYDISMTDEPAFVANGLVVHNSYSTAESAVNSFTDSMLSFRQLLTYKTFYSKVFPLIAVLNNLYKDTDKANVETDTIAQVRRNLADISNLKIPTIQWHKSLEGKDSESQFDMLERLSEKGFVVPLRMWASAAGLDMSALMRDLAEDSDLKSKMEKLTGKRAETIGNEDKKGFDDDAFLGEGEAPTGEGSGAAGGADAQFQASINKTIASVTRPLSVAGGRARIPILARDMTHLDLPRNGKLSKSGNAVHAQYGDHRQDRIMNDKLIKALRALRDPEHAAKVRARRQEIGATGPSIVPPGTFPAP